MQMNELAAEGLRRLRQALSSSGAPNWAPLDEWLGWHMRRVNEDPDLPRAIRYLAAEQLALWQALAAAVAELHGEVRALQDMLAPRVEAIMNTSVQEMSDGTGT